MGPRKKAKLDHDWSWAGIEAEKPEEITLDHRRRAAGLVGLKPCTFDFSPASKKADGCSVKLCRSNPRCYNHVGVEKVLGKKAKEEFVESKVGEIQEVRGKEPAGLRNMGATCYLWFHNISFRNGLYSCAITPDSKLYHLLKVFAFLQHSKRKVVDPTGLVKALKLRTGDQQDAGEFSKLFMNLIEMELKRQQDGRLNNLTERLFQGKLGYVTECLGCKGRSSREESFLELELSLKNNDTLNERIRALSLPETLSGSNQYRCGNCGKLCDATRRVEVRELPIYLHLSLLRFTYDLKDGERKKSKATIRYPKSTKFGGFEYDLCAVVVHLGSSPYHGHFVTELYDEQTKEWYTCSDEEITKRVPNALKKLDQTDDLESSKDAYMLVYRKRSAPVAPVAPPEVLRKLVEEDYALMEQETKEWTGKCESAGLEFETLRGIKEPVIKSLSGDEIIVPRDELSRWIEGDMESLEKPIDYSSLACEHSSGDFLHLDPAKMGNARLISRKALDLIRESTPCAEGEICPTCVESIFNYKVSASDREDQVRNFNELNSAEDGRYLIPKSWLDKWKKHAVDALPTDNGYSLYCGHDAPWPGGRPTAKISAEALALLRSAVGDFEAFDENTPFCEKCTTSDKVDGEVKLAWQVELKGEKAIKREMKPMALMFNTDYYALSPKWVMEWRKYLVTPSPRPPYLPDICGHGKTTYDPAQDDVEWITENGWKALQGIYGPQPAVTMQFSDRPLVGKKRDVYNVKPEVCEPCRLKRRQDWEETEITISLSNDDFTGSISLPMRRQSSRRKTKSFSLSITRQTTIKEIRLEVYNTFGISPISQQLWYDGKELSEAGQTMDQVGMVQGGEVRVIELEEEEVKGEGEEGFGGTALLGSLSGDIGNGQTDVPEVMGYKECPDCTFHNGLQAEGCEMCGRSFM